MITQMKNAVVAVLWTSRTAAQASICASGRQPRASSRPSSGAVSAWVSGMPKPRRADDRDGLEHRRRARPEAEPGTAPLGHAGERHAAGQRDPEAARGRRPGGQEGDHSHVGRPGGNRARGDGHAATVAGARGALLRPCNARSPRGGPARGRRSAPGSPCRSRSRPALHLVGHRPGLAQVLVRHLAQLGHVAAHVVARPGRSAPGAASGCRGGGRTAAGRPPPTRSTASCRCCWPRRRRSAAA